MAMRRRGRSVCYRPDSDLPARPLFRRSWWRSGHQSANASGRDFMSTRPSPAWAYPEYDGKRDQHRERHSNASAHGNGTVRWQRRPRCRPHRRVAGKGARRRERARLIERRRGLGPSDGQGAGGGVAIRVRLALSPFELGYPRSSDAPPAAALALADELLAGWTVAVSVGVVLPPAEPPLPPSPRHPDANLT